MDFCTTANERVYITALAVKSSWVEPEGYRPPAQVAYNRAPNADAWCCTPPATSNHDLRLPQRIENLSVQAFVPQLSVEAFAVAVLLRTPRLVVQRRTTAATVAYEAAERAGVPSASRKVFLDDTVSRQAIRVQLRLAARYAERDGFAIVIGHPHPATIAALAEERPQLEARGIRFVFASDVVQ